jgi:hypothetical protein
MTVPKPTESTGLDKVIEDLLSEMAGVGAETPEYDAMSSQLVKLMHLKSDIGPKRVSPDVRATIMANLAGILVIVGHERAHILTSKALGFIMKLR